MVNTRAKGNRNQLKVIKYLEREGFLVDKVEKHGKFVKQKDMFALFDLVAINKAGDVFFVQVTTNRPHTHKPFKEFSKKYFQTTIKFWQIVVKDRKKEVLWCLYTDGNLYKNEWVI